VPRRDSTYEDLGAAPWVRSALLPLATFVVAAAIVIGLVFSGAVQGHKTYAGPAKAPTTQPTILIQP
jgi:hypothetical protein